LLDERKSFKKSQLAFLYYERPNHVKICFIVDAKDTLQIADVYVPRDKTTYKRVPYLFLQHLTD